MDYNKEKPNTVARQSSQCHLDPGIYMFCTCGLSSDGIFCDGSHKTTSFTPKRLKLFEPTSIAICMCKYSKNMPYCDGSHQQLPAD